MANYILSLIFGLFYVWFSTSPSGALSLLFLMVTIVSNYLPLYLIIAPLIFLPPLIIRHRSFILTWTVLIFSSLHILNIMDLAIYRLYKIHINSMVWNLVTTEGAADTLHLGTATLLLFAFIILILIVLEIVAALRFSRNSKRKIKRGRLITICVVLLVAFLTDKTIYAVSDLYNRHDITRYIRTFPLYQPVTIKSFARKHLGFELDREDLININRSGSGLDYPRGDITMEKLDQYPNIVWILIDAWRYDMFTPELTPNVHEFSKDATVFADHYSGGNASRFGVFSLFYGINAYYWHQFLGERQSPLLIDQLIDLGYDFHVVSSTKLTFPEFRKTCFVRIPESISDELGGSGAAEKDPKLTVDFLNWLDSRDTSKPFFSFLFYDAPHGPYDYPDSFALIQPSVKSPNYLTMSENDMTAVRNGYKNAIHFDDYEVGQVLARLQSDSLLDNTIVLISGDHGEEFYESGFYGHTSAFSRQQTQVPLILYIPGRDSATVTCMTSHLDIVPTTLNLLGSTTEPSRYSQGQDIFDTTGHAYVVSSGWDNCGIIDSEYVMVFSFETYNAAAFEVRDRDYNLIDDYQSVLDSRRKTILKVLQGFNTFVK